MTQLEANPFFSARPFAFPGNLNSPCVPHKIQSISAMTLGALDMWINLRKGHLLIQWSLPSRCAYSHQCSCQLILCYQ